MGYGPGEYRETLILWKILPCHKLFMQMLKPLSSSYGSINPKILLFLPKWGSLLCSQKLFDMLPDTALFFPSLAASPVCEMHHVGMWKRNVLRFKAKNSKMSETVTAEITVINLAHQVAQDPSKSLSGRETTGEKNALKNCAIQKKLFSSSPSSISLAFWH